MLVAGVTGSAPRSEQKKDLIMLVLSRKKSESLVLTSEDGTEITIEVIKVSGNRVSVGITAPRQVKVVRSELPKKEGNS